MIVTGKSITIQVQSTDTIRDLKLKVEKKEGIWPENQRFVFDGKTLEDEKTLADYGVKSDSTFQFYISLPGGCPGY